MSVLAGVAISSVSCGVVASLGNLSNQAWNYYSEKKTKNNNDNDAKNNNISAKTSNNITTNYNSFTEYIDAKSIVVSGISAAVFAPIGLGSNCVLNSAFVGAETGAVNIIAQTIANFYMGGSVSILQGIVDLF